MCLYGRKCRENRIILCSGAKQWELELAIEQRLFAHSSGTINVKVCQNIRDAKYDHVGRKEGNGKSYSYLYRRSTATGELVNVN